MERQLGTLSLNVERDMETHYLHISFIIALETLFIQVRSDSAVRGFSVRSVEIELSAYADDTIFFVKDSHSVHGILKLMGKFQEFSSLKLSVEAC